MSDGGSQLKTYRVRYEIVQPKEHLVTAQSEQAARDSVKKELRELKKVYTTWRIGNFTAEEVS